MENESGWFFFSEEATPANLKLLTVAELTALAPQTAAVLLNPPKKLGHWVLDAKGRLKNADADSAGFSGLEGIATA